MESGRTKSGALEVHRRTLLKMAAAGAAGIWAGRFTPPVKAARRSPQNVLVLGGGLAGLVAAFELVRMGHDVVVLETQHRAGGRVFSSNAGLIQGQVAEFGATRIPDVHDLTLHYANEFGMSLNAFPTSRTLYLVKGKVFFPPRDGALWPLDLTPEEQRFGPNYPAARLLDSSEAWVQAASAEWPPAPLKRLYDPLTIIDWLKRIGAGSDMIALYTAAGGTHSHIVGALLGGAQDVLLENATTYSHIRGGNENLPRAIADALGPRMRYGTSVMSIERRANSIVVRACAGARSLTFEAGHVVCALPPTILRTIPIRPALPPLSARAIAGVRLLPAWKTIIQTRTRFWNDMGMRGLVVAGTDTPAERVWDVGSAQPGSCGLLHQYINGNQPSFNGTTAAQRRRMITAYLRPVLPQLQDPSEVLYWNEFHWEKQPWVRGAYGGIWPDQAWALRVLPAAVGRLHFAGDHTSIWAGWMQGAIHSGLRAAQEIDPAIGFMAAA